ncbi:uncharacterized protein METZ01_LOCUS78487, partial [marine metagenome]
MSVVAKGINRGASLGVLFFALAALFSLNAPVYAQQGAVNT